ncbi:TetR/AcrR family transcriptional regulator [Salinithrix halophila]|uniref:TetR/AcrR family transcriptional regulator n=1 Tax=Salinithrix halophila TaxID=1485204 RepID=A0ABV8JMI1_9BACL
MGQETVEHLFRAAVKVFAEQGFERAKMDDIAREAGVAKGTIYYHFKGKDELFVALMNDGLEKMMAYVRRRTEVEEDPARQLRGLLEAEVDYLFQNGTFAKLLLTEVWGSKERQIEFRARIRELESIIEEVLERGMNAGRFRRLKGSEAAVAIFGAVSVTVLQEIFRCPEVTGADLAEHRAPLVVETLESLLYQGLLLPTK